MTLLQAINSNRGALRHYLVLLIELNFVSLPWFYMRAIPAASYYSPMPLQGNFEGVEYPVFVPRSYVFEP